MPVDTNAGLVGPLIITRFGHADADGKPLGVHREVFFLLAVTDEGMSYLLDRNIAEFVNPDGSMSDDEIAELGKAVRNTKHVALAINEEVDLHQHLLDDLDTSVDNTQSYMKFARRKLEQVSRKSGSCKFILVMILLVVVLALVISMSKMLA